MSCVLIWWQCIVSGLEWPNLGRRLYRLFMHYHKQCKFRSTEAYFETLPFICSDYVGFYYCYLLE